MRECVRDVFAIYDNNISPGLLMIIVKIIILYFIQIRHTDDFPQRVPLLVPLIATMLSTCLLAPPLMSIADPIYLKDWTVGNFTISVSIYLFILTRPVSLFVCRCSVFALLTLSPFSPSLYTVLRNHLPAYACITL